MSRPQPVAAQTASGPWMLEPIQNGQYLLDRSTGMVYSNAKGQQWIELVGRYNNNQLVMRTRNNTGDLFNALDNMLKTQKVRSRVCVCYGV